MKWIVTLSLEPQAEGMELNQEDVEQFARSVCVATGNFTGIKTEVVEVSRVTDVTSD